MTLPLVERLRNWATPKSSEADEALAEALTQHWSSVCETLYYLVGDWGEAEDLALETFWRLHTRWGKDSSGLSNRGAWLFRVATNLGLNAIRARGRRRHYEETAAALRFQRTDPLDPATEVERRQEREQVRDVLSHMKPRRAQLLILRYTDHTYAEIADILGVARSSVGTMLARAEKDFERRYRAREEVS